MSMLGNKGLTAALASVDRRVLFFSLFALGCLATLIVDVLLLGSLNARSAAMTNSLSDAARLQRIVKQTWWIDENDKLTAQIETIKQRFWKGDTIGLVRADVEKFIQDLLSLHGLKASNLLVETKLVDTKGIAIMRAQVKLNGPTAGVIKMLNDLALGPHEVFVSGVMIRFMNEQAIAEFNLDAPTLVAAAATATTGPAPK